LDQRLFLKANAAEVIEKVAEEWSADLVVVGSHRRGGVGRALLRRVTDAVVHRAPCPVLAVRGTA
jgi:nucleotide-binding universal stress UspA family protein